MPGGSPWLRLTGRQPINVPDKPHLAGKDQVLFLRGLARAARYLEYGGGGSTVLAAQQGVSTVCIESDRRYAEALKSKIQPFDHHVVVHYADIGPTGRWGRPLRVFATPRRRRRYPNYVYAPDRYADGGFFDLALVDGRFRVACALYLLLRAVEHRIPRLICFDDYVRRPQYHVIEEFCEPCRVGENMAFFRPGPANIRRLPDDADIRAFCRHPM